jgi:hypothetical protein
VCGEKRVEAADLTVRSFLGQLLEEFASLDARLPRTLRQLALRRRVTQALLVASQFVCVLFYRLILFRVTLLAV